MSGRMFAAGHGMRMVLEQIRNPEIREQIVRKLAEQKRVRRPRAPVPVERKKPGPGKRIPVANAAVDRLKSHLRAEHIDGWCVEHRFHPERGWRFDFALLAQKLAIELDGLTWHGGRHQRPKGYTEDCKKLNEAVILGWKILRFTPAQVRSGYAIDCIKRALQMT